MDKLLIQILTVLTLINFIFCKGWKQELENLKKKYIKKLNPRNLKELKSSTKPTLIYDPKVIKEIIDDLEIPDSYNFFDDTGAKKIVKDQKNCGSCWSHSSTSALGYRFSKKLGTDINLSPQNGLSCYIPDCVAGDYDIDAALHLIKNGTVTEECLPFQSGDGETMPKCPTTCQDGSEYIKYYGKDIFSSIFYYSANNFYAIVAIILDQLVNYGPVTAGIDAYEDLYTWSLDSEICKNGVYNYDKKSSYVGGHAVTLVGYGKLNNKYYWLAQNSWGSESCDNGFIKIEMGQIGIEQVTFIEPYIPKENAVKKEITLNFKSMDNSCFMNIDTNNIYKDWVNTVEFNFKNYGFSQDGTFSMQCGIVQSNVYNKPECYFELR